MALVAVLVASGLAAGAASASGARVTAAQPPTASLTYRCRFPSGPRLVQVAVNASVPAAARAGKPIQPTDVSLTVTLPPRAVGGLASLHSATVRAATWLTVTATEGPVGTSVVWPGTTRRVVPVPVHGGLMLRTTGRAPSVTLPGGGEVVLTAAGLSLALTPGQAISTPRSAPNSAPVPASPGPNRRTGATPPPVSSSPTIHVSCALIPGQHAALASLLVTGKPPKRPARPARSSAAPHPPKCPKLPPGGLKLNPRFTPPPLPPNTVPHSSPAPGCAYVVGYADARKLKGAALIQPGLTNVDLFARVANNNDKNIDYLQFDNAGVLDFHGQREFPPSTATFLTFGFVPTTAEIQLVEHGTIDIFIVGPAGVQSPCHPNRYRSCDNLATVASRLSVRIVSGSVKVNGVPLDVGSHCESKSFDAIVNGTSASNPSYNVLQGGPLFGTVEIPGFHNCGVGQNLDPIFDAAISGPANFNLLTQGAVCFVLGGGTCDENTGKPVIPKPVRKVKL